MSRRCAAVLLAVLVAHLSVPGIRTSESYDVIDSNPGNAGGNHGNMRYSEDDQCTYEDIVQRKRDAVKVQLLAKLKIRTLPNNTRDDIPNGLLNQISDLYQLFSTDRNAHHRQNEADPESVPPKQKMIFPESVVEETSNTFLYKWAVSAESAALDRAELHIPVELATPSVRVYVLTVSSKEKQQRSIRLSTGEERGGVDMTEHWRKWSVEPASNHGILVCLGRCYDTQRAVNVLGMKPFISVRIPAAGHQRVKRYGSPAAQSCDRFPNHCCYKDHYLSFKELGFDHVILEPKVFNAGLCLGVCKPMWLEEFYHSHVISHVQSTSGHQPRNCCAPKTLTDLDVIYYDEERNDTRFVTIPNMLVRECCCK